jgi:hypothetical protein
VYARLRTFTGSSILSRDRHLRVIGIKISVPAIGRERGIKIAGCVCVCERDGRKIMRTKWRMSTKTIGRERKREGTDGPQGRGRAEESSGCRRLQAAVETDRANYNFPIKTSAGKTSASTSRKSPRCKKDSSSNVKNASGLMPGNFPARKILIRPVN